MTFKHKILITPLIFLFSCQTLEIEDSIGDLSHLLLKDTKSNLIEVRLNNSNKIIYKNNNTTSYAQDWINSSTSNVLVTKNGKIVESFGFSNNMEIANLTLTDVFANVLKGTNQKKEYAVRLSNPDSGYLPAESIFSLIDEQAIIKNLKNTKISLFLVAERFHVDSIKWGGVNYYWVDENSVVWKSRQKIHPYDINIEYQIAPEAQ